MFNLVPFLAKATPNQIVITGTITRPNDTAAYAQGDCIANATSGAAMLTFTNLARRKGGAFLLNRVMFGWSQSGSVNKPDLDLFFLNATMATPPVDNAALAMTDAESLTVQGVTVIPSNNTARTTNSAATGSGNLICESDPQDKILVCNGDTTNMYGVVRVLNTGGYTPIALEVYTFALIGEQLG